MDNRLALPRGRLPVESGAPSRGRVALAFERYAPALVFMATFALYAATLYPGVGGRVQYGDAAKWQYIGSILGVSHPPGSPLYILLTYAWTRLPIAGAVGVRVLVFSALCGAGAVTGVFAAARRLGASVTAAGLGAFALAVSLPIWTFSTEAELYAPLALAFAFVIHRLLVWSETKRLRDYALACFVYAGAFGIHYLMLTLLPALAFFVLRTDARFAIRGRALAVVAAAIATGLLPFAWLWLRIPDAPYSEFPGARTWEGFRDFVLARQYRGGMFAAGVDGKRCIWAFNFLGMCLGLPAVLVLPIGAFSLARASLRRFFFLLIAAIGPLVFLVGYRDGDDLGGSLPILIVMAIGVAAGAQFILSRFKARRLLRASAAALLGALFAVGAYRALRMILAADPLVNLTHDTDVAKSYVFDLPCIVRNAEPDVVILPPYEDYGTRQISLYFQFTDEATRRKDLQFRWLVTPPGEWAWATRLQPPWAPDNERVVYFFLRSQQAELQKAGYVVEERSLADLGTGCGVPHAFKYFRATPSS